MATPPARKGAAPLYDVERFRSLTRRSVVIGELPATTVVLGSTQDEQLVSAAALAARGTTIARRRSGGGAVLVEPTDPVWIDLWVPRDDAVSESDVSRAPRWVGEAWASALEDLGSPALSVHEDAPVTTSWSKLVCFAGIGPGEVLAAGRKVVGVAQWRSRQGCLFQSAAYRAWDPARLIRLFDLPEDVRGSAVASVARAAIGLDDLLGRSVEPAVVASALLRRLPEGHWDLLPGRH